MSALIDARNDYKQKTVLHMKRNRLWPWHRIVILIACGFLTLGPSCLYPTIVISASIEEVSFGSTQPDQFGFSVGVDQSTMVVGSPSASTCGGTNLEGLITIGS